jgi:hypothetical protein
MSASHTGSAGNAPRLVDEQFVAVYDPNDGRILHFHTVRTFEGARRVSAEEAKQEALSMALKHGHGVEHAQTLHTTKIPGQGVYRVDLVAKTLVLVTPPPHQTLMTRV